MFVTNTTEPLLTLEEVEPNDRGLYHCIATNSIGSSNQSNSALLTIDGTVHCVCVCVCVCET